MVYSSSIAEVVVGSFWMEKKAEQEAMKQLLNQDIVNQMTADGPN